MAMKRRAQGPQLAPGGMERREDGRVPRPRQVKVYPCRAQGLGRPFRASLTDASPTSIGLTCLGRLAMGAKFVLRLNQPSGPPLLQVYHVVRCRDAGGGASLIGAQFDHDFSGVCRTVTPVSAPMPC
ncbi:MAG TPA: PilZ domain-containing protein [Tepidisphaeraceae bacterium]|nr:PilZ domain-containing protein [Tepidisphaeraceae bacterium]